MDFDLNKEMLVAEAGERKTIVQTVEGRPGPSSFIASESNKRLTIKANPRIKSGVRNVKAATRLAPKLRTPSKLVNVKAAGTALKGRTVRK